MIAAKKKKKKDDFEVGKLRKIIRYFKAGMQSKEKRLGEKRTFFKEKKKSFQASKTTP